MFGRRTRLALRAPSVSIVIPTLEERAALERLAPRLEQAARALGAEVIFVDDASPDGTADWVRAQPSEDRYRLLERPRRMGLASAVVDGMRMADGQCVVVMDGDGSHPPETLPALVGPVVSGRAEFAIASRRIFGATEPGLDGRRSVISRGAGMLARPLTAVTDPMSGFFALDRRILSRSKLEPVGYKIALEVLVRCRPHPIVEVPFHFDQRLGGVSKLSEFEIADYLRHLGRLYAARLDGRASSTR